MRLSCHNPTHPSRSITTPVFVFRQPRAASQILQPSIDLAPQLLPAVLFACFKPTALSVRLKSLYAEHHAALVGMSRLRTHASTGARTRWATNGGIKHNSGARRGGMCNGTRR